MGRGRAPCCDKSKVRKGPWSSAEDLRLISFIQKHGHGNWRSLPKQAGLLRCGKSCRLRWINYLRPDLKRGNFTKEEEETIIYLHQSLGNKWSKIASYFPGRTDNEIKNVWNTYLKKRLIKTDADAKNHNDETKQFSRTSSSSPSSSSSSFMSPYGRQDTGEGPEDVDDQGCLSKRPHEYMKVLEKKQEILSTDGLASSSSSISSHASNYSNSSPVDASMPKEKVGSLNNQSFNSDQVIEIPLVSDIDDIWDLLDHLDPLQSNEYQPQEFEASQGSYDREIESRKWLRCLENELIGLEATSDGGYHHGHNPAKDAAADQLDSEMMLGQEIDGGKGYFQKWPSPPKKFGI